MIKDFFDNSKISYKENVSLRPYNTYRIDTICDFLVFPKDIEELILILKKLRKDNIKFLVLGKGSNVIFSMKRYEGVIIKLDNLDSIVYNGNIVKVEAGCLLIKLAMDTIEKGFTGFEFATGIPGCVGASVAMNAGAYNCEISDNLKEVEVLTPDYEIKSFDKSELNFEYRDSFLKKNKDYIVLSATFELEKGDIDEMKELVDDRRIRRIEAQPLDMPTGGSVFRNPENVAAWKLIEDANLKGYSINDAQVSNKHANFIVNNGNASGEDIIKLINKVKNAVKEKSNIDLKLEQIIIE